MTATKHRISYNTHRRRLMCDCDALTWYTETEATRHLLDAGREAAKGELVTADDPRVKEAGARARLELTHPPGRECEAYEGTVTLDVLGRPRVCGWLVKTSAICAVYLLAEAPNPDAEVRAALASVMSNGDPVGGDDPVDSDDLRSADDLLAVLRAAGYDVVKAVAK